MQRERGELGGPSDVQHLGQGDLLEQDSGITLKIVSSIFYQMPSHKCLSNLVVFGAALILEQSDAFPVQDPVMTFSLTNKNRKWIYSHRVHQM